jgi:hypothetical protein
VPQTDSMGSGRRWVIFLNGCYGVGKSATLEHCGDLLAESGQPFTLMDVDWFHRSWPPGADDPDNVLVEAKNLAAVWANYAEVGPRQLVISGVIAGEADRRRYEQALGHPVRTVRLTASAGTIEARLRRRYSPEQTSSLTWHLERHAELSRRLVDADLDELVMDTDARPPRAVARAALEHFALL